MEAHHLNPLTGEDEMALAGFGGMGLGWEGPGGSAAEISLAQGAREPRRRGAAGDVGEIDPTDPATWGKVPRNAQCPCGSGKKFKHCHGQFVA